MSVGYSDVTQVSEAEKKKKNNGSKSARTTTTLCSRVMTGMTNVKAKDTQVEPKENRNGSGKDMKYIRVYQVHVFNNPSTVKDE